MLRVSKKIDPANLDKKSKPLLASLLKMHSDAVILEAGNYQIPHAKTGTTHVTLTKTLVAYHTNHQHKNRYAICETAPLGKGANSEVFLSMTTIKLSSENGDFVIAERPADKQQAVWRFKPQAEVAAPVEQNKVVKSMGILLKKASFFHAKNPVLATQHNHAALIMRRFPGKPLIDYLQEDNGIFKNGRYVKGGNIFTVNQRIALTIMIAEAISEQMHKNGIIHRDIKADNIILEVDKNNNPLSVHIVDVSSAKESHEQDVSENVGTLGYQAPEMLFADGAYSDEMSDAFAFATMLKTSLWQLVLHDAKYKAMDFDDKISVDYVLTMGCHQNADKRFSLSKMIEVFKGLQVKPSLRV
jgi:serine/threonine protein kinase